MSLFTVAFVWMEQVAGVKRSWLFGSLKKGVDVVPGSDIDLRVELDSSVTWKEMRPSFLATFGERYMVAAEAESFVRVVLESGVVIDLGEDIAQEVELVPLPTAEEVERWVGETLVNMLAYPAVVARKEPGANELYCALYRVDLAKLVYRLESKLWAKDFKHMARWTRWAGRVACKDEDIWTTTLMVLRLLAEKVGYSFPEAFVQSCWLRYRQDLETARSWAS